MNTRRKNKVVALVPPLSNLTNNNNYDEVNGTLLKEMLSEPSNQFSHEETTSIACQVCGRAFLQMSQLKQHLRRKACSGNMPGPHTCEICGRVFNTYIGVKQHFRHAHPGSYDYAIVEKRSTMRRPWSKQELWQMAELEAGLDLEEPADVITCLVENSSRTRDAIKMKRKTVAYRNLVQELRSKKGKPIKKEEKENNKQFFIKLPKLKVELPN